MRPLVLLSVTLLSACPTPPESADDAGRDVDSSSEIDLDTNSFGDPDSDVIADAEVASEVEACDPLRCPSDDDPCTDAACDSQGRCAQVPNLRPCDDGLDCNVDDRCTGGVCKGRALDCDDGEQCTDDSCVEGQGCVNVPRVGPCDDDDTCTTDDVCTGDGACVGQPRVCPVPPGSHGCSLATCDPRTGCGIREGTGDCDDGDLCTSGEQCSEGRCVGALVACDDLDPCTDDRCDPALGCVSTPNQAACEDGDVCTVGDRCDGGQCVAGPATGCCEGGGDCDDGDPCTAESCVDGRCARGPTCQDDNPCTLDACDAGACSAVPMPTVPDDGLLLDDFEAASGDAWSFVSDHADVFWQRDDHWAASGAWSLYIGKVPDYSYDFGPVRAVATWTGVLPPDAAELAISIRSEVAETSCSYDALVVFIDQTALAPPVCGPMDSTTDGAVRWDVSAWVGRVVTLELVFDTVDGEDNDGAGIWLDDLTVYRGPTATCCATGVACP